jgi:outer membrane cobalamin receptor
MKKKRSVIAAGIAAALATAPLFAAGVPTDDLDEVVVTAQRHKLIGKAESSSQGTVTRVQLETRPVLRTGELRETVPGLVVTQHSGDGKRISISCAASTSITAPISRPASTASP